MSEQDFVIGSEQIVKILEQMAERGTVNPVPKKNEYSFDEISVTDEERKQIRLYTLHHRNILSRTGIQELPDIFGEGKSHTIPTSGKLMYLSSDMTSVSYCITIISEIEEAVAGYIKTSIER